MGIIYRRLVLLLQGFRKQLGTKTCRRHALVGMLSKLSSAIVGAEFSSVPPHHFFISFQRAVIHSPRGHIICDTGVFIQNEEGRQLNTNENTERKFWP
mmetsp:Transcript_25845/g.46811  ORF Transcript_25845/g.46811 Transcript_25845/m.46811 type:complete len:98 (-) Transcript_25845:167-460(-)